MKKIKKIKEDIDLKELEKYGYKKEDGIIYIKYTMIIFVILFF